MLTLYLRREPTTDATTLKLWPQTKKRDVVAYRDAAFTDRAAVWPWFYSRKPTRRSRRVMFNCYGYAPVWGADQ
jgi:hypothetical protein